MRPSNNRGQTGKGKSHTRAHRSAGTFHTCKAKQGRKSFIFRYLFQLVVRYIAPSQCPIYMALINNAPHQHQVKTISVHTHIYKHIHTPLSPPHSLTKHIQCAPAIRLLDAHGSLDNLILRTDYKAASKRGLPRQQG